MAQRRDWAALAPSTRKRYLGKGAKLGQTPAQVEAHYTAGRDMGAYRGHKTKATHGISEYRFRKLVNLAKASQLETRDSRSAGDFVQSLLAKGLGSAWVEARIREKIESRDTYLSPAMRALRKADWRNDAGYQPGRRRWHARNQFADIELYYYH